MKSRKGKANGVRKKPKSNGTRSKLEGIKQGVGAVPKRAFGSKTTVLADPRVFNAFMPQHLPLPRNVGDYVTTRTTQVLNSTRGFHMFCPFRQNIVSELAPSVDIADSVWTANCALANINQSGQPIGDTANSTFTRFSTMVDSGSIAAGFAGCKLVPSAFSVQIMNPEALQTTTGIIYIGRAKQVLDFRGSTQTWEEKANELISYTAPRLCSAAKLAMRGVHVDAIPYNMSSLASFDQLGPGFQGQTTYDGAAPFPDGFAPIFVWNPGNVNLQYLICCEWRTRFDPNNPAHAAHHWHPLASDAQWARHIKRMSDEGCGARDITQGVADRGY